MPQKHDELSVSTTSGLVHGNIDPAYPNVRQFLGIPFAKPPVGPLRWLAPQELSQPDQRIEATKLPPSCPQFLTSGGNSIRTNDVLEFNIAGLNETGPTDEDCLTISVWTPTIEAEATEPCDTQEQEQNNNKTLLPVLIYIYGGSFQIGGQNVPYQLPTQWLSRTPTHLVVTFNYRLNLFGFPFAPSLPSQNLGLLDQRLAVQWVRKNILAFGGDPSKMVLWGQSAGATSVDFYNFAYAQDPIVKGLIMDSGTSFLSVQAGRAAPLPGDNTGKSFTFVADEVGCGGKAEGEEMVECMRGVDWKILEGFVANHSNSGAQPALIFRAAPDGKVVFDDYEARALGEGMAKIPAVIGTNAQDGVPFAPYNPDGVNVATANGATLSAFFCPTTEATRLRQETDRLTYRYLYSGNFTNISPRGWMGAWHASELPLIFGTHSNYRGDSTELEYETSHAMQDAWVAFAKDPVNGLASVGWKPYEELGSSTLRNFGADVAAKDIDVRATEAMCDGAVPKAS
ncbi:Carboxylic ester hydrolase [Cercospora zeina]